MKVNLTMLVAINVDIIGGRGGEAKEAKK